MIQQFNYGVCIHSKGMRSACLGGVSPPKLITALITVTRKQTTSVPIQWISNTGHMKYKVKYYYHEQSKF